MVQQRDKVTKKIELTGGYINRLYINLLVVLKKDNLVNGEGKNYLHR